MTSSFHVPRVANVKALALPAPAVAPETTDVVNRYVSALISKQRKSMLAKFDQLIEWRPPLCKHKLIVNFSRVFLGH